MTSIALLREGLKGAPMLRSESQSTPRKKAWALISDAPAPPPMWPRRSGASVRRLGKRISEGGIGGGGDGGAKREGIGKGGEEE